MEDVTTRVKSTRTGREYRINRNYNCQSSWIIYVVTCQACQVQYTGQTKRTMAARHYVHRNEIRTPTTKFHCNMRALRFKIYINE